MTTWDDLARAIDTASAEANLFKGEYDKLLYSNSILTTQVRQLRASLAARDRRIAELEAQLNPPPPAQTPIFTTSEPQGFWQDPGNPNVRFHNEVILPDAAGPQVLDVYGPRNFQVAANHPKVGADPHSIKAYPCIQVLFPNKPLNTTVAATSAWSHKAPALGEWDAAYDIWFNGWKRELMIWTDHRYPGPLPPAGVTEKAVVDIDGAKFTAWRRPNSKGDWYIAFVRQEKAATGGIDLLKVFHWLIGRGWLVETDQLQAIDYGIEIASTNSTPQVFEVSNFMLDVR